MKKLLPISIIAMVTVCPAFADDPDPINNESMCVVGTLNESSNNGTAWVQALWTAQSYSCPAGQYLESDNVTCTTCPAGSYCTGFTDVTFADADIGVAACSAIEVDGNTNYYTSSPSGAVSYEYCYKTGTASCGYENPYIMGHGAPTYTNNTTSCKEYRGISYVEDLDDISNYCTLDTVSACAYTLTCDTGYHSTGSAGALANYEFEDAMKVSITSNTYEWQTEWMDGTSVHGIASCQTAGAEFAYFMANYEAMLSQQMTPEAFFTGFAQAGGTQAQIAAIQNLLAKLLNNEIYNTAAKVLSAREFFANPTANYTAGGNGRYCWCKMDSYSLLGASSVSFNGTWGYVYDVETSNDCLSSCADICAMSVRNNYTSRAEIFGSLGDTRQCTPNTINLTWYSVGDTVYETNQCTYDQPITLPATNPTRTGYTFAGWRLRTSQGE